VITLNLVRITDTSGELTGTKGEVTYQALTDKEEDNLLQMEGDYSRIGKDFKVEYLGPVQIPAVDPEVM
jgi:hypothetical protein